MPWLAGSVFAPIAPLIGRSGALDWWGPEQVGGSLFHTLTTPANVTRINAKGSFATGDRHCYSVGGFTENIVVTDDFRMWTQGIPAPTVVPTVSLAGTGLTAEMICYLRWYDIDSGEWSALSGPSATLSAANQGILWGSFPAAPSPRVTHIAGWRSVDGSLPRLVWTRQIGVTSVQESTALGDLGEAFVDTFELFPRCRYNVIWHDRQVLAGNYDHPDTLYLSLIGDFEKWSQLTIKTRSGQPIVGLLEIGGTLIVICPRAIEIVTGWTEDDLAIEIAQQGFGGIGHHAVAKFHNYAMVWSSLGPYLTDGSGWWPMYKDIRTKWADEYAERRNQYDLSWGVHDPISGGVMLHVGPHSDVVGFRDTFWFAGYEPVIPQVGGGYEQPNWSYDVANVKIFHSGATLAVPGGLRADLYYGDAAGIIYKATDTQLGAGISLGVGNIRTGAMLFGDHGGDIAQGKKFVWADVFVQSESDSWSLSLFGGDEYAFPADVAAYNKTFSASAAVNPDTNEPYQPKTVWPLNLVANRVIGRALVAEIIMAGGVFRGIQIYWVEGETQRVSASALAG